MINSTKNEKTIGITGASGALGKELTKLFRQKGYKVIGFTHSKNDYEINLIFNNNAHIALTTETIEARLEDQSEIK